MKPRNDGIIGHHGLTSWWKTALTEDEREEILARYEGPPSLTEGNWETSATVSHTLWTLSSWFNTKSDQALGLKLSTEALRRAQDPIDKHFSMLHMIKMYYLGRKDPEHLQSAIVMCRASIEIQGDVAEAFKREHPDAPLPKHPGYRQLCIIEEKRKNYPEAIRLAREADTAGWNGDWGKRIVRLSDKMR